MVASCGGRRPASLAGVGYKNSIGQRHRVHDRPEASIGCPSQVAGGLRGAGGALPRIRPRCARDMLESSGHANRQTERHCGRSVARIRPADKWAGHAMHPGGPIQCEHLGPFRTLLESERRSDGRSRAEAALFFQRGADRIPGGKRPSLLVRPPPRCVEAASASTRLQRSPARQARINGCSGRIRVAGFLRHVPAMNAY